MSLSTSSLTTNTAGHHDKTSYKIMPTPPSPTHSSPSLTQSISLSSTSQASISDPVTPSRGRPYSRYPESLGRIPLHRRGTSKTYERLEDLLREAGYKETRIFTPETDRLEVVAQDRSKTVGSDESKPDDRRGSVRGGVDAVVGFLAGLIPVGISRDSNLHRISPDENTRESLGSQLPAAPLPLQAEYSPPASPLVHKRSIRPRSSRLESSRLTNVASSSESLKSSKSTSTPTHPRISTHTIPSTPPKHQLIHRISQNQLPHQPLRPPHLPRGQSNSSLAPTISQPHPSRAGAYLRHMASAPNMPKRPSSSGESPLRPARNATGTGPPRKLLLLNDSDDEETEQRQPPLPRTWLEAVARAVAFGGPGAYAGGPTSSHPKNSPYLHPYAPGLRQTRSSLSQVTITGASPSSSHSHTSKRRAKVTKSKGALLDHTNRLKPSDLLRTTSSLSLAPPSMCARIQTQRSGTSEGQVSQTRVVCRSAPVSRSGSSVRGAGRSEPGVLTGEAVVDLGLGMYVDGKRRAQASATERGRGRRREAKKRDGVPSLARTRAEGDMWGSYSGEGEPNRSLEASGANEEEGNSSSEEEGELDLARILVPPKRQNSIRSLRRHLQVLRTRDNLGKAKVETRPGMGSRSGTVIRIWREGGDEGEEGEDEDWGQGWGRKRSRRSQEEGEEEGHGIAGLLSGTEGGVGGKRRRGIPWAQWAGVAS